MLKEKTSCDEVAGDTTGSKKQLQLTPQLKIWLANLLTPLIDSEADPDDKIMLNALQKKCSHGRSDGIEQIIQRIAVSDHPIVKNDSHAIIRRIQSKPRESCCQDYKVQSTSCSFAGNGNSAD